MKNRTMPIAVYMLFSYFSGVFVNIDKNNWFDWLLPFFPMVSLIGLYFIWNIKPKQRILTDY